MSSPGGLSFLRGLSLLRASLLGSVLLPAAEPSPAPPILRPVAPRLAGRPIRQPAGLPANPTPAPLCAAACCGLLCSLLPAASWAASWRPVCGLLCGFLCSLVRCLLCGLIRQPVVPPAGRPVARLARGLPCARTPPPGEPRFQPAWLVPPPPPPPAFRAVSACCLPRLLARSCLRRPAAARWRVFSRVERARGRKVPIFGPVQIGPRIECRYIFRWFIRVIQRIEIGHASTFDCQRGLALLPPGCGVYLTAE